MQTWLHASNIAIVAQGDILHLVKGDLYAVLDGADAAVDAVATTICEEGYVALVRPLHLQESVQEALIPLN